MAYGLEDLAAAREAGSLILVEGETDRATLRYHGFPALGIPGADSLRVLQPEHLNGIHTIHAWQEPDGGGATFVQRLAARLATLGYQGHTKMIRLEGVKDASELHTRDPEGFKAAMQQAMETAADLPRSANGDDPHPAPEMNPWVHIKSAPAFLSEPETPFEGLAKDLLAPGAITIISAPKGLGKTQVALNRGVALATGGIFRGEVIKPVRVLVLDRDNPEPVLKQRLRNWGAATAERLHVLTRRHAPDLKDRDAWAQFPPEDCHVLIIDAVGAFTEGSTEKEGLHTTEVLATLLDLARRGIAILLLNNVTKDGADFKWREEWADRVDIMYEVRDATGFTPSGKRAWWMDLPASSEAAWAERAQRRRGAICFRLAFIPSKFRLAMEPNPFCLELHLPPEGLWTLKDVTEALIAAGQEAVQAETEAKTAAREAAADALADYVARRAEAGEPVNKNEAEEFLRDEGVGRNGAREIFKLYAGVKWKVSDERRGAAHTLLPLISGEVARFSKLATDAVFQTSEPRQHAAQGGEVMAPENPPQERTVETSPPRQEISGKRKTDRRDLWIYPQAQQAGS